jgi:hypothetical protein
MPLAAHHRIDAIVLVFASVQTALRGASSRAAHYATVMKPFGTRPSIYRWASKLAAVCTWGIIPAPI